ncbi:hypothetical protein [Frankia sp. B2]|uniref:hypothetical protein n=1 Tax=Frankia sp. B2 TaxID=2541730 RepID=UPI00197A78DE|nr:hypothetical protein [Frankia sp. B2]
MTPTPTSTGPEPVPLTVWTTRDSDDLPAEITRRILDTYTQPGDLVVTTSTIPTRVADLCTAAGRRTRKAGTPGTADIPPPILLRRYPAAVDLVLDQQTAIADRTDLADLYAAMAALLRPGGILLTVLPEHSRPDLLADPLTDTVAAAMSAGLIYTQHLLTIRIPFPSGLLASPLDGYWDPADEPTLPAPLPPLRIHADLAVFTRPASRSSR